jgi:hypothetical protein
LETIEELEGFLAAATQDGVRGQLLDRGTAWGIMRQQGELPFDAPPLGETIETDLAEYGFSVLRAALALKEAGGGIDITQRAFERAANAFESLVRNGSPEAVDRGFYRVIGAAAYHLAGYSAIAYSLFNQQRIGANFAPSEDALMLLILRDLDALRNQTRDWLLNEANSDQSLGDMLGTGEIEADDAIASIINSTICRALAYFDFALQTGDASLPERARELLAGGVRLAADAGAVSLWWIARLCLNLIGDLWDHSVHVNLPIQSPEGGEEDYAALRQLFLVSLYGRKNAEVELWPSQLEAARRSSDVSDDLVVSLPTSAGKTRVAEIAALMTLSTKKRVLIVTPLRALSAQTERLFRRTFAPLGFTVSSLYGASGISAGDEDALRSKNIVISTPEKLDFALRNDPSLISDVGLIVLDEGHLIGPTEREIRYEILVQRLLRRADGPTRRIVCLSAILPDGEQLDDLTEWIRSDAEGSAVKSQWRPTRQRFGSLVWQGSAAKLSFDLNDDGPYLARFVEQISARGRQTKPLPRDAKDLALLAAWNFAAQGKRTLVFLTQANWVEGYGKVALDLVERGYLPSLLDNPERIARALEVGREWLGDGHPAVASLKIGVAIHHGGLPNPFLRELELLLSEGVLKVVVASPTLSQGLNLNAAVLLVPSLYRSGSPITGEEFANVAGRAGRAFVDVEGLVVHVIHDRAKWRLDMWRALVASAKSRNLRSGLIQVVGAIIERLAGEGVLGRDDAYEYLANSREAWKSEEEEAGEEEESEEGDEEDKGEPLSQLVEKLDATVFGLIEALDAESADLPRLLDEALQGSLWARQIDREGSEIRKRHTAILEARARLIWKNTTAAARKGHFAMGVGLDAGLELDGLAEKLAVLMDKADDAALAGDGNKLADALIKLAGHLLVIRPFVPDKKNALPEDWKDLLKAWVTGVDANTIGTKNMGIVEDAFAYRLVWALEALRTRRVTLGWSSDSIAGGGAASLETGVPQFMMAMLVRSGLPSRRAAITAVREGDALFVDGAGMRTWLESSEIARLTKLGDWPSPETAALWKRFREEVLSGGTQKWRTQNSKRTLARNAHDATVPPGIYRVEIDEPQGDAWVCTPDYRRLVRLRTRVRDSKPSFFAARFVEGHSRAEILRIGRDRAVWLENEE